MLAYVFAPAQRSDYYETSLFLITSSVATDVYLADINYDDLDAENPISTALRVGFAVYAPGQGQPVVSQYIFELTQAHNPQGRYNTFNGLAGDVLDSSRSDGSSVTFTPLNSSNYCQYNDDTGELTLLPSSTCCALCLLPRRMPTMARRCRLTYMCGLKGATRTARVTLRIRIRSRLRSTLLASRVRGRRSRPIP